MTERVVIVTGSRDWADADAIHRALAEAQPTLVVQGGQRGADAIAKSWAVANDVEWRTFSAQWERLGRRAGPLRNRAMLLAYPSALVLAFPIDGPGTLDCIRQARALRMRVLVHRSFSEQP